MPARGVRNNYQYHNGGHNRNPHGHSGAAGFNERKGGGGAVSTPSALDVAVPCPSGGFMHKGCWYPEAPSPGSRAVESPQSPAGNVSALPGTPPVGAPGASGNMFNPSMMMPFGMGPAMAMPGTMPGNMPVPMNQQQMQMSPDQIQQWQLHQQCMAMHHHRMMMMMQMGMGHAQGPMRPPMGMDMNKMMMSQQEQEEEVNELSRAQLLPEHGSPESQEQAAREQQEEGGAEEGVRNDQGSLSPSQSDLSSYSTPPCSEGSASECLLKAGAEEEGVEDEGTEDLAGQPTPGNQVRKECHGEAVRGGKGGWQRWGVGGRGDYKGRGGRRASHGSMPRGGGRGGRGAAHAGGPRAQPRGGGGGGEAGTAGGGHEEGWKTVPVSRAPARSGPKA